MTVIGDVLQFAGMPERISEPSEETFVTVKLHGGGAVKRTVGDGKTPVAFTGYRVKAGQFIYSRIDARNGAFAIVPPELDGAVVSKDFPIFDIRKDRVEPSYLNHFFRAGRLQRAIQSQSAGATNRQRIPEDRFLAFEFPLLPLDEQRRIAAILDHADALRAKRRQVLDHLDSLTQAIFHDMFGMADAPLVHARDLMPDMRNGLSPSAGGTHRARVLTLTAITKGAFDELAFKDGVFDGEPPGEKRVSSSDLLICRGSGNRSLVGVAAFARTDHEDLVFPDTVIAGRVDTEVVQMEYLHWAWKQIRVRRQIESLARTTSGTFKVNQKSLGSVLVPLPSMNSQRAFAVRTHVIRTYRERARKDEIYLNELFSSLQSRAFTGKL